MTPIVRARRQAGLTLALAFLQGELGDRAVASADAREIVRLCARWAQGIFTRGSLSLGAAKNAIQGLTDALPHLRRCLRTSWDALLSWEQGEEVSMRPPLPLVMLQAVLALSAAWSWLVTATCLCLGYHCMARPGEVAQLRWCDILLPRWCPRAGAFAHHGVCRVGEPKTRELGGRRQIVLITDAWLWWWLTGLKQCYRPCEGDFVCSQSASTLSGRFTVLLRQLGLHSKQWSLESLRAGGTTECILRGVPVEEVRLRGRWQNGKVLEHYVQECTAMAAEIRLGPELLQRVEEYAAVLPEVLEESMTLAQRWQGRAPPGVLSDCVAVGSQRPQRQQDAQRAARSRWRSAHAWQPSPDFVTQGRVER